ncbi:glycosyltransferase [Siphonobacter sp. SORGH_AS_0500]|uniref:glycosyltransferase family 2 protein n=1 Tax=Siphonobacter sp. SORGH_AS_0500 TaxID=1864824 RepID=UPI0028588795|nr:glycosyltransferase [Siphonobacter sp. SORGH_AS_0500]MDR6196892.1 glycosyltransferase involved in cell wall biosynthesis [Siphonobacter sp. SORGH_AS_0500]
MNKENPEVSVIVPVYNVESVLEKCIESILAQTYRNFELILINDGSTDNSFTICEKYSRIDSRITVLHKLNGGASSARNMGIAHAKGKWITFADSDDSVEEIWLDTFIQNANHVDLVVQGFKVFYDSSIKSSARIDGDNVAIGMDDERGVTKKDLKIFIHKLKSKGIFGYLWCKMFRKSIIQDNKLKFNESYKIQEDEDFILRYILLINTYSNVKEGYYKYNHPDYSKKYVEDKNCIINLWALAKIFYESDAHIDIFAKVYGNQLVRSITRMYVRKEEKVNRLESIKFYIDEFNDFNIKPSGIRSVIFLNIVNRFSLSNADRLYEIIFGSILK